MEESSLSLVGVHVHRLVVSTTLGTRVETVLFYRSGDRAARGLAVYPPILFFMDAMVIEKSVPWIRCNPHIPIFQSGAVPLNEGIDVCDRLLFRLTHLP